jgi:hypothetical protein
MTIQAAYAMCNKNSEAVKKLEQIVHEMKAIQGWWGLARHFGKDILVNGKSIFGEVTGAVSDW